MGMAKRAWMEQQEQGWSYSDKSVCTGCLDDYALESAVGSAADYEEVCSFCGGTPTAPLDVLMESFVLGLWKEHEDADDGVTYDSREGGYQFLGGHWDSYDLVQEYADALVGDGLLEAVQASLQERTWVERDFAWRSRDEVLRDAWDEFSDNVKYRVRYVIWLVRDVNDDEMRRWG